MSGTRGGLGFALFPTRISGDHSRHVKDVLKAGINVYGPEDVGITWGRSGYYRFHVALPCYHTKKLGDWSFVSFSCVHDVPCYGYLIGISDAKIVYLPDTQYSPWVFGPGVTHFLISVNYSKETISPDVDPAHRKHIIQDHMSLDTAKKLLAANDLSSVREIWLLHLSDQNSDAEYFKREIQKEFGKPTYVAGA